MNFDYTLYLPPPLRHLAWRPHPLDGKLLLFERDRGLNLLLEGEETAELQRVSPRTLLIAVTNICNLKCDFCYRNLKSSSQWTYESLISFCQEAAEWGVLEVAFGGGEPTLFPHWAEFIQELYATSPLAINFTTNGMFLTDEFLAAVAGKYGNIRLSLYDTNTWEVTIRRLVATRARFGVNWLITPNDLNMLEQRFWQLLGLGVRDFLFLSYKGSDLQLHWTYTQYTELSGLVNKLHRATRQVAEIKLDVCWGDTLNAVPRLFDHTDCGAGDDFLSITSDKRIKDCSFHHLSQPFTTLKEVRTYWEQNRTRRLAAQSMGCARLPQRGVRTISTNGGASEIIPVATIFQQS